MSTKLTLNSSGTNGCTPDQITWRPPNGRDVEILNNSGHIQTLSNITNGCLVKPGQGRVTSITIGTSSDNPWTGKAGSSKGTYNYDDGLNSKLDMRSGTIDPS